MCTYLYYYIVRNKNVGEVVLSTTRRVRGRKMKGGERRNNNFFVHAKILYVIVNLSYSKPRSGLGFHTLYVLCVCVYILKYIHNIIL